MNSFSQSESQKNKEPNQNIVDSAPENDVYMPRCPLCKEGLLWQSYGDRDEPLVYCDFCGFSWDD